MTTSQPADSDGGQYLGDLTKTCVKCHVEKPKSDYSRRAKSSDGLSYSCKQCGSEKAKVYYAARLKGLREDKRKSDPQAYQKFKQEQRERRKEKIQAWVKANAAAEIEKKRARKAARDAKKHAEDNEKDAAQMRKWRQENQEHAREWRRRWDARNRAKVCLYAANRKFRKVMPPWADEHAIQVVYEEAKRLTEVTGVPHDVDHIYPIAGRTVTGLHTQHNLRAVPANLNGSKLNKLPGFLAHELWEPDGPYVFHESNSNG